MEQNLPAPNTGSDAGLDDPLSEAWLSAVGFKWHQLDRQPRKQWLLWLGDAVREGRGLASMDDLGVEVSASAWAGDNLWSCWIRSDTSHRYHRFIHIRYLRTCADLVRLVEGLTGQVWNPVNHLYGRLRTPEQAESIRQEDQHRLDRQLQRERPKWFAAEKDDARGGALPEHLDAYITERARSSDSQISASAAGRATLLGSGGLDDAPKDKS